MLRYKLIRNLLIISLAIAILFPCYDFFFVHPAYNDLITEKTESEAVRYASYMVRTLGLEDKFLSKENLPENLSSSLKPVGSDSQLLKLRIFSPTGEIIFSSKSDEIGEINRNDYFHKHVAHGQVYSKVVRKDQRTAEGNITQVDIVETYVPFMVGKEFGGAFEVYYDVTGSVGKTRSLAFLSRTMSVLMSVGFLLAITVALYRAYISLKERDAAEDALRVANESLEKKISERTRELVQANEQLTEQISERIEAQQALGAALDETRVEREKLAEILRSVPDGVIVADGGLNVLHMNAAAESILDASLEQMLGQSIGKLNPQVDFIKKVGQRLNLPHAPRPFNFELSSGDQKNRIYQVRTSQFVPSGTESSGVILLIRDITREREIEIMKSAFLGMAAHELNTPLTTIIGYAELLSAADTAENFDADQQKMFLQLILDKAFDLGGLIDDLLDISRVESGRPLSLKLDEFALDDTIREIISQHRDRVDGFEFELALPDEKVPVCADPARLAQVFGHLISNAVKYSPEGGRVQVSLTVDDENCTVTVTDEGIGMDEEQLAQIFDRFYRVDTSDTAVQGFGLGMSLVRHVVLAHQGDIRVESQPGVGTKVSVVLPKGLSPESTKSHQRFKS